MSNKIDLYKCAGITYSPAEFVRENLRVLDSKEQEIIKDCREYFPREVARELQTPLTRSEEIGKQKALIVNRDGGRSAYWEERRLKFKGCNPTLEHKIYTNPVFEFGSSFKVASESWGVLSSEAVMRELLALAFLENRGLPNALTPVCVYEYRHKSSLGYCLVLRTLTNRRADEFLDSKKIAVNYQGENEGLWVIDRGKATAADRAAELRGKELKFTQFTNQWYARQMADLLSNLHFQGFFRGPTNGHLGNTIVEFAEGKSKCLYLCDFSTTRIIDLPPSPSPHFLADFILASLLEVLEAAPFVCDYIKIANLPKSCSLPPGEHRLPLEICELISRAYPKILDCFLRACLIFKCYIKKFFELGQEQGWNKEDVDSALNNVGEQWDLQQGILRVVPNSAMRFLIHRELPFIPHNE